MSKKKSISPSDHIPCELPDGSLFRAAFESSRAVMFLVDPQSARVIGANAAACEFYGYDPDEVSRGVTATDVSLLSSQQIRQLFESLSSGGATRFASRHRLKSGELRDMELDAAPITLPGGNTCLFFIGHDITERKQAERSLRRSEGLLRAILDSAADGIAFKDADGVYREVNPAFCRMAGLPCDGILRRRGDAFISADRTPTACLQHEPAAPQPGQASPGTPDSGQSAVPAPLEEAATETFVNRPASQHPPRPEGASPCQSYELTHTGLSGVRHLSVQRSPVFDSNGERLGEVSISRDMTERREAEAALIKSEGLLRAMLQSAQDCICITDENDVLRELNQTFCLHVGRTRAELLNRPLAEAYSGEELRVQLSTNALARETREPVSFVQRMQPQAQEYWINLVKTAVVDPQGRCLGVVSMGRDITAQRMAEVALRQSERRLAGLIRQAPVGVFETDARGGLVFANERMQRQTGRTLERLAGAGWISSIVREDREAFLAVWNDALANKREVDCEMRVLNARGKSQWMSCRIRPMTDAANRFSGYLGVLGDISERKKAESMRSDVESVVRHDLKSPLGSMQNAMELMELLGPLNVEQAKVVAEVRTLTRRMQDLITLSIDLHAMEAGAFKPVLTPVDLCSVVEMQRVELRPLVEGKGLRLTLISDCPDKEFYVLGERRLLDAVFSNLLKNAAEASPEGDAITVRLSLEGPLAEVFIRNQGEVPKSIRDRFFEKYATAGKSGGTGLGTYSARLMVRTLGGTLSLNTEEPGATTLIVRLPAVQPESVPLLVQPGK